MFLIILNLLLVDLLFLVWHFIVFLFINQVTHFAIHSNSKTKPLQDFKSARMYFCLKVQKHEEKIERGEKCRRENILISKCQILILHLSILQFTVPKQTSVQNKTKKSLVANIFTGPIMEKNHTSARNATKTSVAETSQQWCF